MLILPSANTFRFIAIDLLFIGGIIETNYQFSQFRFPA